MTGDWAGSVHIFRRLDIEGSEVPVVVLNDINLILKIFDDIDSLLPDTSERNCSKRGSPTPCQLGESIIENIDFYELYLRLTQHPDIGTEGEGLE